MHGFEYGSRFGIGRGLGKLSEAGFTGFIGFIGLGSGLQSPTEAGFTGFIGFIGLGIGLTKPSHKRVPSYCLKQDLQDL